MTPSPTPITASLIQMLGELALRKWFILAWTLGAGAAMAVVVVLLPSEYTAKAVLMAPASSGKGLGGLSSIAGIGDLLGMDLKGSDDPEKLLSVLLDTRTMVLEQVRINRLDTVWSLKKPTPEDLVRRWNEKFSFVFNEDGALVMGFEDESPERARDVLKSVIEWADSAYRGVNQEKARRNLMFFDERLRERKILLDEAEDSMVAFQARTGTFAPTEQMKQSIIETGKLESQIEQLGIQLDMERRATGPGSSNSVRLETFRRELQGSLAQMVSPKRSGRKILKELKPALDDQLRFERLSRQVLIHGTVYAFLNQQREQYALDRVHDTPVLIALDEPSVPMKRSFPKRRTFVQAAVMFAFLSSCLWVLVRWWIVTAGDHPVVEAFRELRAKLLRWN